jgi:hypothetical protein
MSDIMNKNFVRYIFFILFCAGVAAADTGRILTEIGSIPDQLTLRLASKPDIIFRPDADGLFNFTPAANDFVLILPDEGDEFIYSPRIIPAADVGADTLYIIPPTLIEYAIIVENFTSKKFEFFIDRAIVSEALETAKKDYQLEIIPQRELSEIYVAAIADGFPAVVQKVAILPNQRRGYMKIMPADLGIQAIARELPVEPPPEIVLSPIEEEIVAPPQTIVEIEKLPESELEPLQKKAPQPDQPIAENDIIKQTTIIPVSMDTVLGPPYIAPKSTIATAFFNNRFLIKNSDNLLLSIDGEYALFSNSQNTSYAGASIGVHNLNVVQQNFDFYAHIAKSPELDGILYEGSLIWSPSDFVAMDLTYHGASSDAWEREYFITRTSLGLNGKYLLASSFGHFGIGARFRLDFADFENYVENAVESNSRYLPSFYVVTLFDLDKSTLGFMLGAVNEAIYFNATYLFQNKVSASYTYKSSSQADDLLSPLEQHQQHKVGLSYYFSIAK